MFYTKYQLKLVETNIVDLDAAFEKIQFEHLNLLAKDKLMFKFDLIENLQWKVSIVASSRDGELIRSIKIYFGNNFD